MSKANTTTCNVLIARGVPAVVKFIDQRKSKDRVIAKCDSISSNAIIIARDKEQGFFIATSDGVEVSRSRQPQVAFRRAVRKTWHTLAV